MLPRDIQQLERDKFIDDISGKVAIRTYDTALIEINSSRSKLLEYDISGHLIYVGAATPGSATSATKWQILKFTYDGGGNMTSQLWAAGSAAFDKIWDDKGNYQYS